MTKHRILIVDDTPSNLEILSELLLPSYEINVAINGVEGLAIATSEQPPDLILLDIMMPDIDGYTVCRILKGQPETQHIPIIFVTAMNDIENEEQGLDMGAVDYITKPFNPSIILARIRTQLALSTQTRLLEHLVEARTKDLEKARDLAKAANQAKSAFLANMNHELRTPLNGIMGMTQLLMESDLSTEQMDFLQDAHTSSSNLLNMVNDLLAFSEIDSENITLQPEKIHLAEKLTVFMDTYRVRAEKKGLIFKTEVDQKVPQVTQIDYSRLRQILMNILNNALRFTDSGAIEVQIGSTDTAPSNGEVVLTFNIRNTGVGIQEERQDSLFDPFSIGEDFMTKRYSGAGLGLSIAKKLVSLMGGHIWLERGDPGNTVFSFVIPCIANMDEPA